MKIYSETGRKIILSASALLCMLGQACSGNEPDVQEPADEPGGKVEATFVVTLPGMEDEQAVSRAGDAADDMTITTADGFIFDENGRFIERLAASSVTRDGDAINITLLFDKTPKKRIIHVVANSRFTGPSGDIDRLDFSPLQPGVSGESSVGSLKTVALAAGVTDARAELAPPIMWGKLEMPSGIMQNTSVSGIKLLRACAAVTVRMDTPTPDNGLSDFEILGATLQKPASRGYLTLATNPTSAPTGTPSSSRPEGTIDTGGEAWTTLASVPTLYCYERQNSTSDYMSVIIKAKYKGQEVWYKVLMTNASGTPYNLVRNHRYILTLTQVTAPGYSTLATAMASLPCNTLKASIVDDSRDYSSVTVDQQYKLLADCNTFELFGHYSSAPVTSMEIASVKTDRESAPQVVVPDDAAAWLTNIKVLSAGTRTFRITADFIPDAADHTADLTLRLDNLSLPLKVRWKYNDVTAAGSGCYTVNLLHPGESGWTVKFISGQTATPWCGLNNLVVPSLVLGTDGYVSEINANYNATACLHVNAGSNNLARLRKSCSLTDGTAISANVVVLRHAL